MTAQLGGAPRRSAAVMTALTTAWDAGGDVDASGTAELAALVLDCGLDGVFVAGTNGEFPALDDGERLSLLEAVLGRVPADRVVAHVGAATTRQAVRLTRAARALGATRLAAITPYFVPAGPRRLLEHYEAVASAADGADVYVYAFPRLAATEVPPDTLSVLARIENVVGVKVSGAPLDLVRAYVDAVPAEFEVWSGDDATLPEVVALGGAGVVSGVSGAFPERFAALTSALRAGAGADQAQAAVLEVVASLRGDIGRIKTVLGLRGLPAGECRLAVDPPDTDEVAQLARLVADDTASARHRSPSGAGVPA